MGLAISTLKQSTHTYSTPQYGVKILRHVKIPMRDGVNLVADLFMPDAEGEFPVVLEYLPYRKDDRSHARQSLQYYMAECGYVGCRLDVRGTGSSEGIATDEYTPAEQRDGCDAVQWLSEQPWCNGNVAMWGISYGGFNSVQVAMHQPPALKAIVPIMFTDDRYKEECHYGGGSVRALYTWCDYPLNMVAMNALPPHPGSGERGWLERWRDRLEEQPPWVMRWLREQVDGEYWFNGSLNRDYSSIQCAVFAIGGWRDGYPSTPLRTFANITAPKKVLIGPWTHKLPHEAFPGPKIDYIHEVLRFFDYWLKGVENGVMDEPPVTVYVQEHDHPKAVPGEWNGYWRTERAWPQPEGETKALYPGPDGRLSQTAPGTAPDTALGATADATPGTEATGTPATRSDTFDYDPTVGVNSGIWCWAVPVDQREDDARSLTYETEPLAESLEIIGEPKLEVDFSATAEVAGLSVRLVDVAPDGEAALVSKGYLNAGRRNSHREPEPLEPGKVYRLEVPIDGTAWRFRPGHRLRLSLAGAEWPNIWPTPYRSRHSIDWGSAHSTRLLLPAVPPAGEGRRRNFPQPSDLMPVAESRALPGAWDVTRDQLHDTVSVYCRKGREVRSLIRAMYFAQRNEVTATVKRDDPSDARVSAECTMELEDCGQPVQVVARSNMTSTEAAFHVALELNVQLDGQQFFHKRWDESIPRNLM